MLTVTSLVDVSWVGTCSSFLSSPLFHALPAFTFPTMLPTIAVTWRAFLASFPQDISNGDMSVILKLGELERMVLWQAAVADEWRLEHAAAKAAEEKAAATAAAAPGGDQEMVDSAAAAAGGAAASASASAAAGPADEACAALAAADSAAAAKEKEKKRKSPEELSCDILLHFAHTARAFDQVRATASLYMAPALLRARLGLAAAVQ